MLYTCYTVTNSENTSGVTITCLSDHAPKMRQTREIEIGTKTTIHTEKKNIPEVGRGRSCNTDFNND